ncbi:MAG: hypothetical protein ACJAR1_002155 [Rubritalea sp.]|jgi:hypothetical protein
MSEKLELKIQLTVLNDLGIKLYSNTPAVLSELVANSWDADANNVNVDIHTTDKTIVIKDDGCGMSFKDLQDKYLTVGYQKRGNDSNVDESPKGRKLMGRKGIGKLSMFSIAKRAEIHTVKRDENGKEIFRGGLILELEGIEKAARSNDPYLPEIVKRSQVKNLEKGTSILLTDIDKRLSSAVTHLRTRLARRFSVTGSAEGFDVKVNKTSITPDERGYFHRLQYVWWFGKNQKNAYRSSCKKLAAVDGEKDLDEIPVIFDQDKVGKISGWIGFVHKSSQTVDEDGESLNKVILMVRGKLATEDLLPAFKEDRLGKVYMIGEIHADFMDDTKYEDIALSSRQGMKENASRYESLINALQPQIKTIVTEWDKRRKKKDEKDILELPGIKEWMNMLNNESDKKFAKSLVSKITSSTNVSKESRKTIVKHCVLSFEHLRYQDRLDQLDEMTGDELGNIAEVFSDISRLEVSAYGEIAKGRVKAIKKLQELVDDKELESKFQILIANNLWLLDAAWERGVQGDQFVEKSIKAVWGNIQDATDLKDGRVDIAYKTVAGLDVIVELKRSSRKDFTTQDLIEQCNKYIDAYLQAKEDQQEDNPQYKIFLVLGHFPKDWQKERLRTSGIKQLESINASVLTYEKLLASARESYKDYLEANSSINDLQILISKIENS